MPILLSLHSSVDCKFNRAIQLSAVILRVGAVSHGARFSDPTPSRRVTSLHV